MMPNPLEEPLRPIPNSHLPNGQAPQWKSEQTPSQNHVNLPAQVNGNASHHEMNGWRHAPSRRPLTVDEALQYSPFSSIVPFDSSEFIKR